MRAIVLGDILTQWLVKRHLLGFIVLCTLCTAALTATLISAAPAAAVTTSTAAAAFTAKHPLIHVHLVGGGGHYAEALPHLSKVLADRSHLLHIPFSLGQLSQQTLRFPVPLDRRLPCGGCGRCGCRGGVGSRGSDQMGGRAAALASSRRFRDRVQIWGVRRSNLHGLSLRRNNDALQSQHLFLLLLLRPLRCINLQAQGLHAVNLLVLQLLQQQCGQAVQQGGVRGKPPSHRSGVVPRPLCRLPRRGLEVHHTLRWRENLGLLGGLVLPAKLLHHDAFLHTTVVRQPLCVKLLSLAFLHPVRLHLLSELHDLGTVDLALLL
eukprot:RCo048151